MPPPQLPKVGKNLFNAGASKGSNAAAGRIGMPETIVCYVCKRAKPEGQYSGRQLQRWKNTIYQPYAPGGKVKGEARTTCKNCTPDQTTELTCIVCGETNSLKSFAKTQRKNPDTARCKNCINKQADTAPDLEVPDSDEYVSSESDDDADFDTGAKDYKADNVVRAGESTTYAASTNSLTLNNLNRLENSTPTAPAAKQPNDGWVTKGRNQAPADTRSTYSYQSTKTEFPEPLRQIPPKQDMEVRKSGWAKVEKIRQQPKARGGKSRYDDDDDDDDDDADDETASGSAASAWTDRKQNVKSDFDTDPWARYYR
ncbi:hypothetical protein ABW20_dc0106855 [Dactylellina cionopaga]|nr:hypothetical protein ABW20_dc0106855 [Dactylellina cionopaga]